MTVGKFPSGVEDLVQSLKFSPNDGYIWLADQRVQLFHMSSLISLRRDLINSAGTAEARGIFTRMGEASGIQDAMFAIRARKHMAEVDSFLVGPRLHALKGVVSVEPVRVEADLKSGHYYSELIWRNSSEAEAHVAALGPSDEPVCWCQLGHASGYTSVFMQRQIVFREVQCVAAGDPTCRIIGKPEEEWAPEENVAARSQSNRVASRVGTSRIPEKDKLVGNSPSFMNAQHLLSLVAPLSTTVLLLGETGAGKEIFGKAVHQRSARATKPLLSVNCGSFPENRIEAELFGVERGAYTGADTSRPGWFEVADGGTLFLDEIGALTIAAQTRLLRVIQESEVVRVGTTKSRKVDVRLICATNVDLEQEVREGRFRADLFYRINIYPIRIPALRERRDDVPRLAAHFLEKFSKRIGKKVEGFSSSSIDFLLTYNFPGNVRELENMIERAVILVAEGGYIEPAHLLFARPQIDKPLLFVNSKGGQLEAEIGRHQENIDTLADGLVESELTLRQVEDALVQRVLNANQGNISLSARKLGISRAQLRGLLARRDAPTDPELD